MSKNTVRNTTERKTKIDWQDVAVRSAKTFIQTAISIALAQLAGVSFVQGENLDNVLIGIAISACAAGVSAVWNAVLTPALFAIREEENDLKGEYNGESEYGGEDQSGEDDDYEYYVEEDYPKEDVFTAKEDSTHEV